MANRLSSEKSLYLQQHAENPVDWWPWGEEAFAEAERLQKPVLVSIGYSACHWCHVMAHESFEDEFIAQLMNKHFVCVKVDREERPDVDHVMMEAVQMITQQGGWPLHAFCFPDGRPFFGGTYFPPKDMNNGMVPWPQLLMRISEYYQEAQEDLLENAESIAKNLQHSNTPREWDGQPLPNESLVQAALNLCGGHDDAWGGFGRAPKFPPSMSLDFLLSLRRTRTCEEERPELAARIDEVVTVTLQRMACGGLFDQLGGGFFRYSVDAYWQIPHFEKMLYDNALLLDIYSKAWLAFGNRLYRDVVRETVVWLEKEMALGSQGFQASMDADSPDGEGQFYAWTPGQIEGALSADQAAAFMSAYQVTEQGNFEEGVTHLNLQVSEYGERADLEPAREQLLAVRQERVAPAKDPKYMVSWNSLCMRGLAEAAFALGEPDWLGKAVQMHQFIYENMWHEGSLSAVAYEGVSQLEGYLDDYAFYVEGTLAVLAKVVWIDPAQFSVLLQRAVEVFAVIEERFKDASGVGFYFTSAQGEASLVSRKKLWHDNAIPCGNASLVHSAAALRALTGQTHYEEVLQDLRTAYRGTAETMVNAQAYALAGFTQAASGIAVLKGSPAADWSLVQEEMARRPWRKLFLVPDADVTEGSWQLCVGEQCLPAQADVVGLLEYL